MKFYEKVSVICTKYRPEAKDRIQLRMEELEVEIVAEKLAADQRSETIKSEQTLSRRAKKTKVEERGESEGSKQVKTAGV